MFLIDAAACTKGLAVLLGSCELYGNRCIENHTLLQGVTEILILSFTLFVQFR